MCWIWTDTDLYTSIMNGSGSQQYIAWVIFPKIEMLLFYSPKPWAQKWWFLTHLLLPTITILARIWPNGRSRRFFLPRNKTF